MIDKDDLLSQIEDGDISVFKIKSQTTQKDKRTLLAVQNFLRGAVGDYSYIEIGSHLGGSLVPHLADPACTRISSVDLRPEVLRDERGRDATYDGNSTERMIDGLAAILPIDCLTKMRTYDCDAGDLREYDVPSDHVLGMIDGEHTNVAAFRDFLNLRKYMAEDCVVLFHDSNLVFDALLNIETMLRDEGTKFASFFLPGILYGIAFGKLRKPARKALGPLAHDPDQFVTRARRDLQERIAKHLQAA